MAQLTSVILIIIFITFSTTITTTNGARILAIFPYPSHSHQIIYHEVTIALANRGHELTVFTADPMNKKITNYTEHSLNKLYNVLKDNLNFVEVQENGLFYFFDRLYKICGIFADETYSHPEMKKILSSTERKNKFDFILMATNHWDGLYYLSDLLDAPMIGITSLPGLAVSHHKMGNPLFSSYLPDTMLGYTDNMTFLERLHNFYYNARQIFEYHTINLPIQEKVLKKHFGNDIPNVSELSKRLSMLFINTHPFFNYPRPMVPGIIQIGGLRLGKMNKTLPDDLKKILDNAKQGFIYFSLGSNIKSIHLRENTLKSFMEAFGELPYQILWKFEADKLVGKPSNVHIQKWIPQQGVLAHPNIKLFVYQGGAQSTEEAISNGIPILGCPFFSDQWYNLNILMNRGAARALDINNIDKEKIKNAIIEMVSNESYRDNIVKLRELMMDRPQSALEEAIWWIEHVIRHNGATHLRTRSIDLPFYKIELFDVYLFILAIFIFIFFLGWELLKLSFSTIERVLEYSFKKNDFFKAKKFNW
ncbi:UDP-glucosyltransferase 2-like [Aphidius gifuensis]|uniref:UDP-glucosyltransferase 2-like n=1 Tax=Aphidius gifuensis TaxID=684658 RepID=UPI001CDD2D63|nr:UDP-glucosyltransferase 2-like [Aphidius gifuensis]